MHPYVVGELLLGGLCAENEALLRSLPCRAPPSPEALYESIRRHDLAGTGFGWVDAALLAAARTVGAQLDTPLARCAGQLDIATPVSILERDQ